LLVLLSEAEWPCVHSALSGAGQPTAQPWLWGRLRKMAVLCAQEDTRW
jgi:hypothetical protein